MNLLYRISCFICDIAYRWYYNNEQHLCCMPYMHSRVFLDRKGSVKACMLPLEPLQMMHVHVYRMSFNNHDSNKSVQFPFALPFSNDLLSILKCQIRSKNKRPNGRWLDTWATHINNMTMNTKVRKFVAVNFCFPCCLINWACHLNALLHPKLCLCIVICTYKIDKQLWHVDDIVSQKKNLNNHFFQLQCCAASPAYWFMECHHNCQFQQQNRVRNWSFRRWYLCASLSVLAVIFLYHSFTHCGTRAIRIMHFKLCTDEIALRSAFCLWLLTTRHTSFCFVSHDTRKSTQVIIIIIMFILWIDFVEAGQRWYCCCWSITILSTQSLRSRAPSMYVRIS